MQVNPAPSCAARLSITIGRGVRRRGDGRDSSDEPNCAAANPRNQDRCLNRLDGIARSVRETRSDRHAAPNERSEYGARSCVAPRGDKTSAATDGECALACVDAAGSRSERLPVSGASIVTGRFGSTCDRLSRGETGRSSSPRERQRGARLNRLVDSRVPLKRSLRR